MAELVVYPDAHPETASVDGEVGQRGANVTWATLVGGAGSIFDDDNISNAVIHIDSDANVDRWDGLWRGIFLFDTSALSEGAIIVSAILSLYGSEELGEEKTDELGISPNVNIFASAPASNIGLENGDFATLGSVPFCDTPITYAAWVDGAYNDFILNDVGLLAISKTGITKLGTRNVNYDLDEVLPGWIADKKSYLYCYQAEGDADKRPRLTITYYMSNLVDQTIVGDKVALEAIRNIEIVYGGRAFIGKTGNFVYESRYHRNV